MKELNDGLFATEEQMPCSPKAICIQRYALPATLERAEREEAAARILSFSLELNEWVGVSWGRLQQMMEQDFDSYTKVHEAKMHNWNEREKVAQQLTKYRILCFLTLGIWFLFVNKPKPQLREVDWSNVVFSTIFSMGLHGVSNGILELVDRGMLRHEKEAGVDVFFPTPALLLCIMQKQGISTT